MFASNDIPKTSQRLRRSMLTGSERSGDGAGGWSGDEGCSKLPWRHVEEHSGTLIDMLELSNMFLAPPILQGCVVGDIFYTHHIRR